MYVMMLVQSLQRSVPRVILVPAVQRYHVLQGISVVHMIVLAVQISAAAQLAEVNCLYGVVVVHLQALKVAGLQETGMVFPASFNV
jgi:hypothetical protein